MNHTLNGGAHRRNLANTIEPSICGGGAAFFSNYFDQLSIFDRSIPLRHYATQL